MRWVLQAISVLSILSLVGCSGIEQRPETLVKKPLPALGASKLHPTVIWTNHESAGSGKTDANLKVAVSNHAVITADHKGKLIAVDRKTGKTLWRTESHESITSGPTLIKNRVLLGTRDAKVLSFNAEDGTFLWKTSVSGEVLAAMVGGGNAIFVHALDGSVTALNAENGHHLWRYSFNLPSLVLRRSSAPAVSDSNVIVGFANGKVVALHRLDGSIDWEKELAVPKGRSDVQRMVDISADPIVKDNLVYVVAYQGRIAALSVETGKPVWEKELSSYSGFALSKQALYVADAKGTLWALDKRKGDVLWKQEALQGRHLSPPEVVGNRIVVGDDEGYLHWLSETDGQMVGRLQVDSKGIDAKPCLVDGDLYVLGRGGKLTVFGG